MHQLEFFADIDNVPITFHITATVLQQKKLRRIFLLLSQMAVLGVEIKLALQAYTDYPLQHPLSNLSLFILLQISFIPKNAEGTDNTFFQRQVLSKTFELAKDKLVEVSRKCYT